MTRSDFFKSVAGALAIFGIAKAVKPEPILSKREIKWLGHTIEIETRKSGEMARYAREAEVWSDWKPYNLAVGEVRMRYMDSVSSSQSAARYERRGYPFQKHLIILEPRESTLY